ncbi:MAG: hypothetical protein H7Z37_05055 [Pyrinomonadaceae bacterium]|nr:hypothetical protein [Pyrinomonadaceae bacterium]
MQPKRTEDKIKFSSLDVAKAMQRLDLKDLIEWKINFAPIAPSDFYVERLKRLEVFDLVQTETAKELVIDAVFEEALANYKKLRVWKAAPLSTDELTGRADYLVARRQRYVETPLLCVAEAKRDDFEKGLGQCLAEMEACQWINERDDKNIDIYGIVTNGEGWKFYKLTTTNEVFETVAYTIANIEQVLGALGYVFGKCEENLQIIEEAKK